jgi:hypothetical protein
VAEGAVFSLGSQALNDDASLQISTTFRGMGNNVVIVAGVCLCLAVSSLHCFSRKEYSVENMHISQGKLQNNCFI